MRLALESGLGGHKPPAAPEPKPAVATELVRAVPEALAGSGDPWKSPAGGTGTLQGAPADAVMAAAASRAASPPANGATRRDLPAAPQMAPRAAAPYGAVAMSVPHAPSAVPTRRARRRSPRPWLFLLPFVIGGGVAAVVLASGGSSSTPSATGRTLNPSTAAKSISVTPSATTPVAEIPTDDTTTPPASPTATGGPHVHHPGGHGSHAPSAGSSPGAGDAGGPPTSTDAGGGAGQILFPTPTFPPNLIPSGIPTNLIPFPTLPGDPAPAPPPPGGPRGAPPPQPTGIPTTFPTAPPDRP